MTVISADWRAVCDDSGDQDDPQHKCAVLGGCLAKVEVWDRAEPEWDRVLKDFEMPWSHMKELAKPEGAYTELRGDPARLAAFLAALGKVIRRWEFFTFGSAVLTADLRRFNRDHGRRLDAYALMLYGCLMEVHSARPELPLEVRLDRISITPYGKIETARGYLATHPGAAGLFEALENSYIAPFPKGVSFKTTLAIQMADFVAWEVRRSLTDKSEFLEGVFRDGAAEDWYQRYLFWQLKRRGRIEIPPRDGERDEFMTLPQVHGSLWDYASLSAAHEARGGVWSPDD